MESILIYPESAEQLKTVQAVLKALKVPFEPQSNSLPVHVLKGIEKSIEQYENNQAISMEEFKKKHFAQK